jgi:hypothetical protein
VRGNPLVFCEWSQTSIELHGEGMKHTRSGYSTLSPATGNIRYSGISFQGIVDTHNIQYDQVLNGRIMETPGIGAGTGMGEAK